MKKAIFLFLTLPLFAQGQINTPQASPLCKLTQTVGLTEITLTYSRPGVKGRKIFGDLVPYGELWRTGANAATKIKFSEEVNLGGNDVPAGEYALYTIPGREEWTLIVHKNTTYWGTSDKYKKEEDQCRIQIKPETLPVPVETMTFNITDIRDDECFIELVWETTRIRVRVSMNTDKKVMAEIDSKMKGVTSSTYYQAARYYLEHDKDLITALEWIDKSLEGDGKDKFWIVRTRALILAKMGRYKEATQAAQKSIELAREAKNQDYVRMNEKSIEEWKDKKELSPPAKKGSKPGKG